MTAREQPPMLLPSGLRERVLAASWRARAAGRPVPDLPQISPAEAFSRAADAFHGMLCALSDVDWRRPVLRDLDVQGLVGHLIGVETDVHRCVSGDPAVADVGHVESTQLSAQRQAGREPAETRAQWRRAADQTLELVQNEDLAAEVAIHAMRLPLAALLIVRAFELWTHDNDIRQVAGLPPAVPDTPTLRLMTGLAALLLPYGAARAGLSAATRVHLVLTGPGGGTWDLAVGDHTAPEAAAVGVVADAVGFCQLVANRITPAGLGPQIAGDAARAAEILAAATTLALD
jgi:Mycothiol maleylpyruvate isomerase N-terminal domain